MLNYKTTTLQFMHNVEQYKNERIPISDVIMLTGKLKKNRLWNFLAHLAVYMVKSGKVSLLYNE